MKARKKNQGAQKKTARTKARRNDDKQPAPQPAQSVAEGVTSTAAAGSTSPAAAS